jgi:hypothetical protein
MMSAAMAIRKPMSRPWKPCVPQMTGSCALDATSFEIGTVDRVGSDVWSGPPAPKSQDAM